MDRALSPEANAFTPTVGTTLDEVIKAAYFVATSIDAPTVEVVNPHVINLHYAADGSLATIKVEGRPGVWGGIGPHGTLEEETLANTKYDEAKAAAAPPPPEGGVTSRGRGAEAREREKKEENHKAEHRIEHKAEHKKEGGQWQN